MEVPQWGESRQCSESRCFVLILILMEVPQWGACVLNSIKHPLSLNPYSNGSTTMGTMKDVELFNDSFRLNPYSNGSTTMGLFPLNINRV